VLGAVRSRPNDERHARRGSEIAEYGRFALDRRDHTPTSSGAGEDLTDALLWRALGKGQVLGVTDACGRVIEC
jgi:hypothetical protein